MLVRLMFASRAAAGLGSEELTALMRGARARNAQHGITGVLCHSEGLFLQVIEGGRSPVNQLYKRIAADPRHTRVELLSYQEIAERRFAGWAMGLVNMARVNRALLLKYSATTTLDPYAVSGAVSMALFDELVATASVDCGS